jgi:hypothetical protein
LKSSNFWQFFEHSSTNFYHFDHFLTIFDQLWLFSIIFRPGVFDLIRPFLDHFQPVLTISISFWPTFEQLWPCFPICAYFDHFWLLAFFFFENFFIRCTFTRFLVETISLQFRGMSPSYLLHVDFVQYR